MKNIIRLKEVLQEKNISGKDLASTVGVSITTISNISTGNQHPKPELLLKIAKALNIDIRELFISTKTSLLSDSEINRATALLTEALGILNPNKKGKK